MVRVRFVSPIEPPRQANDENCLECATLKPTTAKIDKESVSWNLSWQPDGRCNSFTKESILAYAPPNSGVYGLFNFDCQIFIGESSNIREALLRHESETDFQSQHLRPTGFTFERCAAELRKTKADELIARFRPVLQTGAVLAENGSPSRSPIGERNRPARSGVGNFFRSSGISRTEA